ncbi:hypothetical protein ATANTOWER_017261 [Ataeniobius toweri]|uniref:Uncharacterized protein n=1 Tax=Ataeniobius toweri TaxID=208326 RepID=A0ABU7C8N8_9TELE|nr:hypothetical protein [Ataeniobius toweri]
MEKLGSSLFQLRFADIFYAKSPKVLKHFSLVEVITFRKPLQHSDSFPFLLFFHWFADVLGDIVLLMNFMISEDICLTEIYRQPHALLIRPDDIILSVHDLQMFFTTGD